VELPGGDFINNALQKKKRRTFYRDLSGRDGRNSRHRNFCFFTKLLFPFNTGKTQKKIILVSEVSSVEKKNKLFWSQNFSWGKEKQSWSCLQKNGDQKVHSIKKKRAQDSSPPTFELSLKAYMGKNTHVFFSNREHPICGSTIRVKMATDKGENLSNKNFVVFWAFFPRLSQNSLNYFSSNRMDALSKKKVYLGPWGRWRGFGIPPPPIIAWMLSRG
jgi:hypothetical protein